MMNKGRWAISVLLAVVLAGCATEQPQYGPTVAGPTTTPGSKTPRPVVQETLVESEPKVPVTGAALCKLFTSAEITKLLGLQVGKVVASRQGPYSSCTWKTTKAAGGIVTITRADGRYYAAYEKKIVTVSEARKARGRKELEGLGAGAFAMGASVNGVPTWQAVALQGGLLTGVEVSGAGSKSSIATVKEFLIEILARG
jgi:hypothetical protein